MRCWSPASRAARSCWRGGRHRVGKGALFAPCPPSIRITSNGGHAEFIIGRAFARPVGFAHPTALRKVQMAKAATAAGIASGQCLCGKVCFEIDVPARWAWHDHSPASRRAHGAAYATYVGSWRKRLCPPYEPRNDGNVKPAPAGHERDSRYSPLPRRHRTSRDYTASAGNRAASAAAGPDWK